MDYETKLNEQRAIGEEIGEAKGIKKTLLISVKKSIKGYRKFGASDQQILDQLTADYSGLISSSKIKELLKEA